MRKTCCFFYDKNSFSSKLMFNIVYVHFAQIDVTKHKMGKKGVNKNQDSKLGKMQDVKINKSKIYSGNVIGNVCINGIDKL